MLPLPFLPYQNRGDLVLGRLWRFPISPLVRVTASARTAHLYVIGTLGKGKSKLLEYCLYQDIPTGRGCGLIDPHSLLAGDLSLRVLRLRALNKPASTGLCGVQSAPERLDGFQRNG
jgi:ABC-type antimicrobial peptide transport system ATPase subunit